MINNIKAISRKKEVENLENRLIQNSFDEDAEETRIERACRLISPIKPLEND